MSKDCPQGSQCVMCKNDLKPGAKKCTECDSYQSWCRRALQFSTTVLALLIALISVTGVLGKPIVDLFTPKNSELHVAFFWAVQDQLALFISNRGTRPGGIRRVVLTEPAKEPRNVYIARGRLVDPGKTEELLLFSPDLVFPEFFPLSGPTDTCLLEVYARSFSGQQPEPQKLHIPCRIR